MSRVVIVTGNRGYLGPIVVKSLRDRGYLVVGVDPALYDADIPFAYLPDVQVQTLNGILTSFGNPTAVVHLAAISNDPMGDLSLSLTYATNVDLVAEAVDIFPNAQHILASSASVYGVSNDVCVEQTPVSPLTAYADSKVKAERVIETMAANSTILRFATLWGESPNFRVDLFVNRFALDAVTTGKITPLSNAKRPLLHVRDAADAIVHAVEGGKQKYFGIYNVTGQNTTVFAAANVIGEVLNAEVVIDPALADSDYRSYFTGTLRDPHLCPSEPFTLFAENIEALAACAGKNRNKLPRIEELKRELAGNN